MLKITFALVLVVFGLALAAVDNDLVVIDSRCPSGQSWQCGADCNTQCDDYVNPKSDSEQLIRCFSVPCTSATSSCRCAVEQGFRFSKSLQKCIPDYQCHQNP